MKSVFCIIDSKSHSCFEICSSREVAESHLLDRCYSILYDAGIYVEIVERVVWFD